MKTAIIISLFYLFFGLIPAIVIIFLTKRTKEQKTDSTSDEQRIFPFKPTLYRDSITLLRGGNSYQRRLLRRHSEHSTKLGDA